MDIFVNVGGKTYQLPTTDPSVGVSLPIKNSRTLVKRLEVYLKKMKIPSKVFAEHVLGVSGSVFSNMKKRLLTSNGSLNRKDQVIWGRVQFFLDNIASE